MRSFLLLLLCACARGPAEYVVHRAWGPIRIDGLLAEPAWDAAQVAGPLVRSLDGKPASAATEARLLWDDENLYVAFSSQKTDTGGNPIGAEINARLWVLNLSDGDHSLLEIAERSGISFGAIGEAADLLCQKGLLSVVPEDGAGETPDRETWQREKAKCI